MEAGAKCWPALPGGWRLGLVVPIAGQGPGMDQHAAGQVEWALSADRCTPERTAGAEVQAEVLIKNSLYTIFPSAVRMG
jgi:hypothetical protein